MRPTLRYAFFLIVLLLVISVFLPTLFRGPYPHPAGPTFDREVSRLYLREIESWQPGIVLLGDSLLTKGVDQAVFQDQIGIPSYKLDIPGSSSALWYLVLRSNIVPAEPAPRMLVILFRDTLLTAPAFRTTGPYFGLIDKFARPSDNLLIQRAYLAQLTPMQTALERYFPLYTYRAEIRESLDGGLRHLLPSLFACDRDCADDSMTGVLGDIQPDIFAHSIRQAEQALYTPQQLDFASRVEASFLPEIIRLSQTRGIQLVLVRAPTNIFLDPASQPEGLDRYMQDLSGYLGSRSIPFLDLSRVEGIGPAQFVDPHHLTPEGKAIFTRALAGALKSYFIQ
jgi:hypothetical protein